MREIQRKLDSKEELSDIVLKCDTILHSKGYTTTVKPNRIEFFQKLRFTELTPLIALVEGIGEGVLIFKKESHILKIEVRQKLLLYGFLTILVFAMLAFLLTLIKDKGFQLAPESGCSISNFLIRRASFSSTHFITFAHKTLTQTKLAKELKLLLGDIKPL